MKNKTILFSIPIILSAITALLFLSGFPDNIRLTPARCLLNCLILALTVLWFLLLAHLEFIIQKEGLRSLLFQFLLLLIVLSVILIISGEKLILRDGSLYTIGAFIQQSRPFLYFFIFFSLCCLILIFTSLYAFNKSALSILLRENSMISDSFLIFIACLIVYGAFLPLRDNYYPSHDSAIFAYFGQQILRGKMPYTELWDHKPPVIFYINALGLKLSGGSLAGVWLLEFILFFTGSFILYLLLKRYYRNRIIIPILFFGLLHYVLVFDFGNYTEEISLFFAMCSLYMFFRRHSGLDHGSTGGSSKPIVLFGFLCGILCGLAFTCKQNTIGCWCALFIFDCINTALAESDKRNFKKLFFYWSCAALGFISVNAAWVLYFAKNNALQSYWNVAFWFNFIYSEHSSADRLACAWTTLTFLPFSSLFLLTGFLSWPFILFRSYKNGFTKFFKDHPITAWAIIDLPIELIFAGLSGMNYQHYFILCITPVIILICETANQIMGIRRINRNIYQAAFAIFLFAASLPLLRIFRENYIPRTPSSYTKVRDYILDSTEDDQPILVWGSRSAIYVMSGRYAPTAYFNERPLYLFPGEIQSSQWEEFLDDIAADPPQIIVYTHDTALPFITRDGTSCVMPPGADYTQAVYQYFCDHYRYETTINPEFYDAWDIYRRK